MVSSKLNFKRSIINCFYELYRSKRHPKQKTKSNNTEKQLKFEKSTTDHPLLVNKLNRIQSNQQLSNEIKPSIIKNNSKWIDPLSAALNDTNQGQQEEQTVKFNQLKTNKKGFIEDDFENWTTVQTSITNKSVGLIKSIKIRTLLTEFTSNNSSSALNFIQNLNNLRSDLIESWQSSSRVKALRTVSLCAKNLGELERFDLYAYKFILTTKILDEFNELVYKRIDDKVKESDDIEVVKETCKNWSYKICSIQELLPRIYLEIATLNTFGTFFIYDTTDKLMSTIQRLTEAIRGIGDPFIASFSYAYLCKSILSVYPDKKELYFQIYSDFLLRINQIKQIETSLPEFLVKFDLAKPSETCTFLNYTQFYSVPLNWILNCLLYKSKLNYQLSEQVYKELNIKLSNYQTSDLFFIIFNLMLPKLNAEFVIVNHKYIIELIKILLTQNTNPNLPKYQLITSLSSLVLISDSSIAKIDRESKLNLFKEIWKLIKGLNEKEYIICTNSWIDFAVRYFKMTELNSILNNIIKHVLSKKEFINCSEDLVQILVKILNSNTIDFQQFLTSDIVVPFIEMFQKESTKVLACKTVIEHLLKRVHKGEESLNYNDPDYMSILIYLLKTMHDYVDQITGEEERKELSNLINDFINLVHFDDHVDQLDFLVQCRSNFSNFNQVIIQLVFNANRLTLEYGCGEKENDLNSNSFLKACLAFACITIPSVNSEAVRAMLYLNTAQIALRCSFIEQTEFFIRSAISTLDSIDYEKCSKSTELYFVGYIKSLLSFLILVPDDLSKGYLYLFKKLLKTVIQTKFKQNDYKIHIYLSMLNFLSTMYQPDYPYHLDNSKYQDLDKKKFLSFFLNSDH